MLEMISPARVESPGLSFATRLMPNDLRGAWPIEIDQAHYETLKRDSLEKIQTLAKREVKPEDFHVRGMLLCNSARDYYYSRFSKDALNEIAELLPGAPVMRSHNYQSEPVGTFFDARVVQRGTPGRPKKDSYWVEALYYLPRDADGDALVRRIDLGIQREVSIGWRCAGADCSECGDHIATCGHIPGEVYSRGICDYTFSGILGVLEGSFVFRGGQKDTETFIPDGERSAPEPEVLEWCDLAGLKRRCMGLTSAARSSRAVGLFQLFGEPGDRRNTQAVACSRFQFPSMAAAARWVRDHEFRADRRAVNDDEYVFEQFGRSDEDADGVSRRQLDEGVSGLIVKPKPRKPERSQDNDLERWFSQGQPQGA